MARQLHYDATAKTLHWLIVVLMVAQFAIGWVMPDIRRGMTPGAPMTMHISLGMVTLALIVVRLAWRIAHPVAPEASLPSWQQLSSEALHWVLYAMVLVTTVTGWAYASFRGWSISFFFTVPLPMLSEPNSPTARAIGRWHEDFVWVLLALIGLHVAAALVHHLYYRDGVLRRILPGH